VLIDSTESMAMARCDLPDPGIIWIKIDLTNKCLDFATPKPNIQTLEPKSE
jgi:hypothetical protein